ncbi:MAG: rhomboid family intramembrane serine protease [Lachnospiraceae bacterium]
MNLLKTIREKIDFNAPVTLGFAAISLVMLILGYITGGASTHLLCSTYRAPLTSPMTYVRLFTHVLGHSDWTHYLGNMVLFFLLCPMMEEKYGSKRIVIIMFITAGVTGVINNLFFPRVALLGASGIVFMLIMLASFANVQKGKIPLTFLLVLIYYVGNEVVTGLTVNDTISQMAHIVGGICGAVGGMLLETHGGHKEN